MGKVKRNQEIALSKKIDDQNQMMKMLREQLPAFAMELEAE